MIPRIFYKTLKLELKLLVNRLEKQLYALRYIHLFEPINVTLRIKKD